MGYWKHKQRRDTRPAKVQLASWREGKGWTQEEAALNLMVAPHMYKRWEDGSRVPHISTLLKLETVAGIDWQAWMSVREGWQQVCS